MPTFPKNVYWASSLTGGGQGALDAIDGADLIDIDAAFVIKLGYALFYSLDADSGAAESSPDVIAPDVNPGDKRWILTGISEIPAGAMKQLKNIGATTISAAQWGYVGAMDHGRTVWLTTPLTDAAFDGDSFSNEDEADIDLSAFGTGCPSGIKAVYLYVECNDAGSAAFNAEIAFTPGGVDPSVNRALACNNKFVPDDTRKDASGWVPCDANGDIRYRVRASGDNTYDVRIWIWGYILGA